MKHFHKISLVAVALLLLASTAAYMPYFSRIGTTKVGFGTRLLFPGATVSSGGDSISVTAADASASNEGLLSVTAATSNSSGILSNTSGATAITIGGDANTLVTENTGSGAITVAANQPVVITLAPILFTDSLKTTGTLTKDYFTIPALYNGWTVKSVVWGVRYAGSGTGSLIVGFDIYNNAAPRVGTFTNVLAGNFTSGDVEKVVSGGGQTVATGQLWVPRISTDNIVTHPIGLTVTVVLQPV